ncbi:MAG: adenylate/guanylate cyclase domain-containing protein [Spirochaetes bacterium]|nr:adenylate/guanylate cyclase domain-containing protein [Spirochaetota bacterium]
MEKVRRAVLCCDISGFMRLAITLGDRMPGFVQEFYEMAGDAIVGLGGTLVKYIGDSILSVFPEGREIDAVQCALRMRGGFAALLGRYAPGDGAQLGVAISTGELVQGVFGHRSLRLEDVMGEIVANAFLLNRYPGIKVTGEVRNAIGAEVRTEELPAIPLKWRGDPLDAWAVLEEQI